jgi:cytochrome c biogenesis protein CcdA
LLDPDTWLQQVPIASPIGLALVAATGLLMGMAPSSLPLASVVPGYVGGQAQGPDVGAWRKGLLLSTGFILGLATVDSGIGVLFGFLGTTAIRLVAGSLAVTNLFLAALLVVLGLALLRKIRIVLRCCGRSRAGSIPLGRPMRSAFRSGFPFVPPARR